MGDKNNSHVLIKAYKDQNVKGARKMQSSHTMLQEIVIKKKKMWRKKSKWEINMYSYAFNSIQLDYSLKSMINKRLYIVLTPTTLTL